MKKNERLETTISIRLFHDVYEEARSWAALRSDTYDNFSHYVRAALIKLNKEEEQKMARKILPWLCRNCAAANNKEHLICRYCEEPR